MIALVCGTCLTSALAGEWRIPDVDDLPMNTFGRVIRTGRDLIVHAGAMIGPDAADPAKRYSGNGLECQSCHLDAGTKKFGLATRGRLGCISQVHQSRERGADVGRADRWLRGAQHDRGARCRLMDRK
jgi:thiosulfate dehydrogenase